MPTGLGSRPTCSCSHPRSSRYISFARQWGGSHVRLLTDFEQFHIKNQCRVGRNYAASTAISVTQNRRNSQLPFATRLHSRYAFIPALDYLALSQRKHKWLARVPGAVELIAIC